MKSLLASLFVLLGVCRFISIPADGSIILNRPATVYKTSQDTTITPVFNPEKITLVPINVLAIRDTAMTAAAIGQALSKGYGELFAFINQQQLQPGRTMAFYYSSHAPFVMDAAIEVNKLPGKLTGHIKARKVKGGEAIVVHYQGPYDGIGAAYAAITNWLTKNNKKAAQPPFEVYLNNPATVNDPALLLTDVYQCIK